MKFYSLVLACIPLAGLFPTARAATSAVASTSLEFRLLFKLDDPELKLKIFPSPITGTLSGAGRHEERWGDHARGYNPNKGTFEENYATNPALVQKWGPSYATEAQITEDSFGLLLSTAVSAFAPVDSFASAKTTATTGIIASIYNPTSSPLSFDYTIVYDTFSSVAAIAESGGYALALAEWNFSLFGMGESGVKEYLVGNSGHDNVSSTLPRTGENVFKVSSILNSVVHEATRHVTLDPEETLSFNLEAANLYSYGIASAPDPSTPMPEPSTFGMYAMIAAAFAVGHRVQRCRKGV